MVKLSAAACSFIATLRVSLVSVAVITLCVASQQLFIVIVVVVVYFVIDSVRKLLDTPSYFFPFYVYMRKGNKDKSLFKINKLQNRTAQLVSTVRVSETAKNTLNMGIFNAVA
jgi:uncharacterized protein HemY